MALSHPVYEIRRGREVICHGNTPNLNYSPATLRDMEKNGLHLYADGKRVTKEKSSCQEQKKN